MAIEGPLQGFHEERSEQTNFHGKRIILQKKIQYENPDNDPLPVIDLIFLHEQRECGNC